MRYIILLFSILCFNSGNAQDSDYWQQKVDYTMDIQMNSEFNNFTGHQTLLYTNNSPDTLYRVFYHLYYNAFQPGSMMDVRSRTIRDPDQRIGDRISKLTKDEIGYQKVISLTQNGKKVHYKTEGTILVVDLENPIYPGTTTTFKMNFEAQIPLQVRRTGRDNKENIRFSMSQWYPKICGYDRSGWHPNPYIAREFYSPWGDFDVTIHISPQYVLGGTGELQDPEKYKNLELDKVNVKKDQLNIWHFIAKNVPDFMWAADPEYTYHTEKANNGVNMEFLYQPGTKTEAWKELPSIMSEVFDYADQHFGKYPYDKYAFIQGGDGGMEYPMGTLITGERSLSSLVGVSVHEIMHSWYQLALGTNESLYPWMDEGFTDYATVRIMNHLRLKGMIPGEYTDTPFSSNHKTYRRLVESGVEEPMTTHADHYNTNFAYGIASYTKGGLFLNQMEYIVGKEVFDRAILRYFNTWKFKHPTDQDMIRIFEKESDMILDWYREYWVQSTKWIDYSIEEVASKGDSTQVILNRNGLMPMPIDIYVTTSDGTEIVYTIPLVMMRNAKKYDSPIDLHQEKPWPWVNPEYSLKLDIPIQQIKSVYIDRSERLVDINPDNNNWINPSKP